MASSVTKISEPKQVAQIGGGLGIVAGIHFVFAGYLASVMERVFWMSLQMFSLALFCLVSFLPLLDISGRNSLRNMNRGKDLSFSSIKIPNKQSPTIGRGLFV